LLRERLRLPLRLLRFPGLALGVAAAGAVLAGSVTATSLWQTSAGNAAMREVFAHGAGDMLLTVRAYGPVGDLPAWRPLGRTLDQQHDFVTGEVQRRIPGLGAATRAARIVDLGVRGPAGAATVTLAAVDNPRAFVPDAAPDEAGTAGGDGVWLDPASARQLGVAAGDHVTLTSGDSNVSARVAGVSSDLEGAASPLARLLRPEGDTSNLLLTELSSAKALSSELNLSGYVTWAFGLAPGLLEEPDSAELRAIRADLIAFQDYADDSEQAFHQTIEYAEVGIDTRQLSDVLGIHAALVPPMDTISLTGQVLGLALAGAAAVFAVRRRRGEMAVLNAHGVARASLAARLAVETLLPLAAGGVAGWAASMFAVNALGPMRPLARAVTPGDAIAAALPLAAGLVVVAAAAWFALRRELPERQARPRPRRGRLASQRLPWELVVLGLAAGAGYEILSRGSLVAGGPGGAPRVDQLIVIFPLLAVGGLAGLVARGLERLASSRPARDATFWVRRGPAGFLAARRIAAAPRTAVALLTLAIVSFGLLAYGVITPASTRASVLDKARQQLGSDVVIPTERLAAAAARTRLAEPAAGDPDAAQGAALATEVARVPDALIHLNEPITILAVDPASFQRVTGWEPEWSDPRLAADLFRQLDQREVRFGTGGLDYGLTLPAIYVAPEVLGPPGQITIEMLRNPGDRTPVGEEVERSKVAAIDVLGTVTGFPGYRDGHLFVVGIQDLEKVVAAAETSRALWAQAVRQTWKVESEVWGEGDAGAVLAAAGAAGITPSGAPRTAATLLETPAYASVRWTFGLLQGFALLSAIVTLAALLLYAVTRQQARTVSYALARRMGLRRRAHLTATTLELCALLLVAYVAGIVLALATALLIVPRLDPLPSLLPRPEVRLPFGQLAVAGLALPVVALLAAVLIQFRSDRANIAEVLRHAG
jgi:hypothetical protein